MFSRSSLLAAWGLFAACQGMPGVDERFEENVVVTTGDVDASFAAYQTFAVSPIAAAHVDLRGGAQTRILDGGFAAELAAHAAQLMSERGYRRVELDQSPELGLGIGLLEGIKTATVTSDAFGASYGASFGFPGAGYYYPYSFTYFYRAGALTMVLLDLKRAPVDASVPAIWSSIVYRAFPPEQPLDQVRVGDALQQAFQQSPYLHR
ncbi:MAG TPA: DUF4136 domain-containing protein [Polyangiales bacterium]